MTLPQEVREVTPGETRKHSHQGTRNPSHQRLSSQDAPQLAAAGSFTLKMEDLNDKLKKYFGKYINDKDTTSKEYFKTVVGTALKEYNLSVSEIAKEFQVADSTVERWARGVAVPHHGLRQKVLEWIVGDIQC